MSFLQGLSVACKKSSSECRKISEETMFFIDRGTRDSEVYGSESEATFKAILYNRLRGLCTRPNELALEPLRVYENVDLAYCKGGLTWREDQSEVHLIEVKEVAKQERKDALYAHNIKALIDDIESLQDAKKRFRNSVLISIAACVDHDSKAYLSNLPKLEKELPSELKRRGANLTGINFIVC